jgi:hypothetical protein
MTRALVAAAAIVLTTVAPASAHPTALTSVTVVAGDDAAEVAIATDADALQLKLGAMRRGLAECIDLRADGVRAPLQEVASEDRAPFRLRAALPRGVKTVTFSTSLVYGSYPVVFRRAGGDRDATQWLQGTETSAPFAVQGASQFATRLQRLASAVALGFTHILPAGMDHVLFVLGLFFLTTRLRAVLAQVTAFTLAHSITLGLTLYGVVSLPSSVVEPLIAVSIAYVAFENLVTSELKPWRLVLVFGFGLLHGMGFAGALSRLELPRAEFLTTLVGFNLGVEAGQLTVIAAATLIVAMVRLSPDRYRRTIVRPASLLIGAVGLVWTIRRGFFA